MTSELPGWLATPALTRIWGVLSGRLENRGLRAEGTVVISALTRDERHAASALVGRAVTSSRLTVDLAELDALLIARSGVGGLAAVLQAATGRALRDLPAQRTDYATIREAPYELARARLTAADSPSRFDSSTRLDTPAGALGPTGSGWLTEWLAGVRRSGLLTRTGDPQTCMACAVEVLHRLTDRREPTSRTELAAALTGGAHGLDDGTTVSALVLRGLAAHTGLPTPADAAARRALWERYGVGVDAVSTTCLTLGLRATSSDGAAGVPGGTRPTGGTPWPTGSAPARTGSAPVRLALAADCGDPVHLTAWDLRGCTLTVPPRVLVCENPRVLEAVAERGDLGVPVVCVSGQPTLVVLDVLRRLAGSELLYHGDFDWPGVAIANRLIGEVGVSPWRMSADDYLGALGPAHPPLAGPPVTPAWDAELGAAMGHQGVAVHEEAVLDGLLTALS